MARPANNANEPRIVSIHSKVPPIAEKELRRISDKEKRHLSTICYYLLLRGIEAYRNDGELFREDELGFLRQSPIRRRGKA